MCWGRKHADVAIININNRKSQGNSTQERLPAVVVTLNQIYFRVVVLVQGALVDIVGAAGNTGTLWWVVPRNVQEGVYYLVISPLTGNRRLEVSAHTYVLICSGLINSVSIVNKAE